MACILKLIMWALIFLNSGVCSITLPKITDRKFIDENVKEHNRARSSVSPPASNMKEMTWDDELAITAKGWAQQCLFDHNPRRAHPNFTSVGENIWTGVPPSSFDVAGAIQSWVNEKQYYDFNSQACTKVCGHYTQVVWASSYKVGCAANLCPNGVKESGFGRREGVIFVCNYAPAGNVRGRKPYESNGATCPGCEGSSGSNYLAVLVTRPIALILTFVAAHVVRHFYPDIFCYE
ncbi:glioma pathogenesis-related protein 1 [Cheilinus undulatus]|uniref:glioma pathogenesis-related protein 1 n=1 Tax=Cheilinus undulatus TaxID=241271 RepID=UPI001BD4EA7C|nr:glioma pathogenesis-related protein 1 [Cheilinus undulatus]